MRQTANLLTALLVLTLVGCATRISPTSSPWGEVRQPFDTIA